MPLVRFAIEKETTVQGQLPTDQDLASRVFRIRAFQAGWALFLLIVLYVVSWPIRNALLVCWVYGRDAYLQKGIRVLPGKPIRFSDGTLTPLVPDLIIGFGMFFLTTLGLSLLLVACLRVYEQYSSRNRQQ